MEQSLPNQTGFRAKRTSQLYLLLIVGLVFFDIRPAVLWSQDEKTDSEPGLSASLDRESARPGAIVVLTLSYRLPEGGHLPEKVEIQGLEGLTVLNLEVTPEQIRIKILVDRLDTWKTGPLSLPYLDKAGETHALTADGVSIPLISNLGEKPAEAQLRPIQGIIPTKSVWLRYLPWSAGVLSVLLALAGVMWWRKKRRRESVFAEVFDPPDIKARRAIEQLEAQGLFEKGEAKGFYFRLSEILRQYLEALRGFPAAEFTTEEIASRVDNEQDRLLIRLLREADLVKFADTIPTPAKKEEAVDTAISYIKETGSGVESSKLKAQS
ncbi:MAG TPA: hypothetical protein EYP19_13845 [Desulfobacterales bacterium]|nr:hypothetical protein [Desulfobacterales bacterium]